MTGKRQEEILKRFMDRYSLGASSALNDVEKEAIGALVGATENRFSRVIVGISIDMGRRRSMDTAGSNEEHPIPPPRTALIAGSKDRS